MNSNGVLKRSVLADISRLNGVKQALANFTRDQRELPNLSVKESVFELSCGPSFGASLSEFSLQSD